MVQQLVGYSSPTEFMLLHRLSISVPGGSIYLLPSPAHFFIQAKQTLHEDSSASLERGELSETSQAGGYDVGKTFLSNHLPIRAICVPISCQRGTTTCTVPSRKKTGCWFKSSTLEIL